MSGDDCDEREDFLVWCPDQGDTQANARTVRAIDFEGAVEAEVNRRDWNDPYGEDECLSLCVTEYHGKGPTRIVSCTKSYQIVWRLETDASVDAGVDVDAYLKKRRADLRNAIADVLAKYPEVQAAAIDGEHNLAVVVDQAYSSKLRGEMRESVEQLAPRGIGIAVLHNQPGKPPTEIARGPFFYVRTPASEG